MHPIDGQIRELRASGKNWSEIGDAVGLSREAARRRYQRQAVVPESETSADVDKSRGIVTPAPIVCDLPPLAEKKSGNLVKAVLYSDSHFPYHDPATLAIVAKVTQDVRPDILVHVGDLLDCYALSRFDKDPERMGSLQSEINLGAQHLGEMARLAPNARRVYKEGNHEDRLRKILWSLPQQASALTRLTNVRHALTWPALLRLDLSGWEFDPYQGQTGEGLLPKMLVRHGTVVRKWSGASARGEWEHAGHSGASGHVHRLGFFMHRKHDGGAHFWCETGCTCTIDPEYMTFPDWQQGFCVITCDKKTGAFQCEPVYVRRGFAIYRDAEYRA